MPRFFKRRETGPTRVRKDSNRWLRPRAARIGGRVLSIGSLDDSDGEGGRYRDYFKSASEYVTSEVEAGHGCDLVLDVQNMAAVPDEAFDCVFCSGVLEHVVDFASALSEIHRILRSGGTLLLGVPFRQAIHLPPTDYWRFTEFGVRAILGDRFEIVALEAVDTSVLDFPAAYWVEARRLPLAGEEG